MVLIEHLKFYIAKQRNIDINAVYLENSVHTNAVYFQNRW